VPGMAHMRLVLAMLILMCAMLMLIGALSMLMGVMPIPMGGVMRVRLFGAGGLIQLSLGRLISRVFVIHIPAMGRVVHSFALKGSIVVSGRSVSLHVLHPGVLGFSCCFPISRLAISGIVSVCILG
jgi:hypothetical protein